MKHLSRLRLALCALVFAGGSLASAQMNIYWRSAPNSTAWNAAPNWASSAGGTSGGTVPNSATTNAVFGASSRTSLIFSTTSYTIAGMTFASGAPAYTFNLGSSRSLTLKNGIVNNSSNAPTFAVAGGALSFEGGSTVNAVITATQGGTVNFSGTTATAGTSTLNATDSTITLNGVATLGTASVTLDNSDLNAAGTTSAGASVITANDSDITFSENSTLGTATLNLVLSDVTFTGNATGGHAALVLDANSHADFEGTTNSALSIGSLAGEGTVSLAGVTLTIGSNNTDTVFSGDIRPSYNDLTATGAGITKVGTGNLTLSGDNSYTGDTTISAGTLTLGSATATGDSTIVMNGGTLGFGTATTASIGGLAGSGALVLANTTSAAVTLSVGFNDRNTTYSGNLSGAGGLNKIGYGALTLSGTNTQSGATVITTGALRYANTSSLSTASNIQFDGGVIELVAGGPSDFTTGTGGGQVQWLANGGFGASGGDRTVTLNGNTALVWGENNFIAGTGALVLGSATSDGTITLANAIELGEYARIIQVDRGTASLDAILSGTLTGSNGFIKTGAGSLALHNATYTGATRLYDGSLRLDTSSHAPAGSNFIFSGGVLELGAGAPLDFTLGTGAGQVSWTASGGGGGFAAFGADRTVTLNGGVDLAWDVFGGDYTPLILGSASADSTVTLANNFDLGSSGIGRYVNVLDGSAVIDGRLSGIISGSSPLVKNGPGTLALTGANTYSGATWLQGGSLEFTSLANLGSAPSIEFYGGTLRFATGNTTDVSAYLVNSSGAGIDTNGNDVTFATALSGYYLKSGEGTLTLTASGNAFSSLGVNGGTLALLGSGTTGLDTDPSSEVKVARDDGTTADLVVAGTGVTWSMPNLDIGYGAGSAGSMTITDSASVNSHGLYGTNIGVGGTGSLSVSNGGSFSTNYLTIGRGAAGTVVVDNGTVTVNQSLTIGDRADGTLSVQNGGIFTFASVDNSAASLGSGEGAGIVNVSGTGSQFIVNAGVQIGYLTDSALTVSGGGSASSGEALVGRDGHATGTVTITGAGSAWNINLGAESFNFALSIANGSHSTVTLANGGAIHFTGANKTLLIGTTSALNLGHGGTAADLDAVITNAGTFVIDNTNTATISSLVTGNDPASTFTKTGSGTAILAKGITGNIINVSGGVLQVGDGTSVMDLGTDYTFSNGGSLVLNTSYGVASVGTLAGAGSLTFQGGGTLTIANANTYTGATTIKAGTVKASHASALGTTAGGIIVNTGGALNINAITLNTEALSLAGTGVGGTGALIGTGVSAFGGALTLTTDSAISSVPVSASDTFTLSGVIGESGGARALTKLGTATLVLSGANTYSGLTTVSAGTLRVTHASALGTTDAGTVVNSGAALNLNAVEVGAEAVSLTGTGISTTGALTGTGVSSLSGAITLLGNSSIGGTGNTLALSGIIGESGGARTLTKVGSGTLVLSGANTYTGATTLSGGTLRATTSTDALGLGTLTLSGGTLALANDTGLAFNRNTTLNSGSAIIVSDRLNAGDGVTHSLGTLSLSGTLTFNKGSNVNGGIAGLTFGAVTLGGNSTLTATSAGTRLTIASVSAINRNLTVSGAGDTVITGIIDTGTGTLTKSGAGTLTLSAVNTYSGGTTLSGGTLRLASDTGLAFNSNITVSSNVAITSDRLTVGDGVTHTLGTLSIGYTLTVNKGAQVTGGTAGLTFGNVSISTTNSTVFTAGAGTLITLGGVTSSNVRSFTVNGAGDTIITGAIDTGIGAITKSGTGTLTLSGTNTYSGNTTISAGTVHFTKLASLYNGTPDNWTAARLNVASGATAAFNVGADGVYGEFTSAHIATLSALGSGTTGFRDGSILGLDTSNALAGSFTHGTAIANTNGGVNSLGLTKLGNGSLVLTAANTYTGATSVKAGSLIIDGSLANTAVTVTAGATLAGTGSIAGSTTIQSSATLAGSLTFTGGLILENAAQLSFSLGSVSDQFRVSGGELDTVSSLVVINLIDAGGFVAGTYTLVDFNGATFDDLDASAFHLGTVIEGYTYALALDGETLVLTVSTVPEPASTAAALAFVALAGALWRRPRQNRAAHLSPRAK